MSDSSSTDDESMVMPMVMMGVIVLFALYSCFGPASDPNKEKTHSMHSSRRHQQNYACCACLRKLCVFAH